jgi:propanol-preferring alcohol dehydrogenase
VFARQSPAIFSDTSEGPEQNESIGSAVRQLSADVPIQFKADRKGGRVVCAGIHMSDIPSFPYVLLWGERQVVSVANLTRQDGVDFLRLVPAIGIVTQTTRYPLTQANQALADLRAGKFEGAAVLMP